MEGRYSPRQLRATAIHTPLWKESQKTAIYIRGTVHWRSLSTQKTRDQHTWVLGLQFTSEGNPTPNGPAWPMGQARHRLPADAGHGGLWHCSAPIVSRKLLSMVWRSFLGAPPNPNWAHYVFNWAACFTGGCFIYCTQGGVHEERK